MRVHSEAAWKVASRYGFALSSETRDLAAWIDTVIAEERERCAKIAEAEAEGWDVNSSSHPMRLAARASVNMARLIAATIRKAV